MTRNASPSGVFFVGVGHDGTPGAAILAHPTGHPQGDK